MQQYLDLISRILEDGEVKEDRTGVGTKAIHGTMMEFDLRKGFPILTTKKVNFKAVVAELLWFIKGSTNIDDLDSKIWDDWAENKPIHGKGDVGPIYGFQWRHWGAPWCPTPSIPRTGIIRANVQEELTEKMALQAKQIGQVASHMVNELMYDVGQPQYVVPSGLDPMVKAKIEGELRSPNPDMNFLRQYPIQVQDGYDRLIQGLLTGDRQPELGGIDQLAMAIDMVKNNPSSRRILVTAWNPSDIGDMGLPPCHMFFQLHPSGEYLDLTMYQRSCDMAIGVPFNIASYALLLSLIANECGLKPRWFKHMLGDAHVYLNHIDKLTSVQLKREPKELPTLKLPEGKPVFEITPDDIVLEGYEHDKFIKFEVAV